MLTIYPQISSRNILGRMLKVSSCVSIDRILSSKTYYLLINPYHQQEHLGIFFYLVLKCSNMLKHNLSMLRIQRISKLIKDFVGCKP